MANPKDDAAKNAAAGSNAVTQGTLPTGQAPVSGNAVESAEDRLARAELMVERMMQVSEKQTAIINRLLEEKADAPAAPAPVYAEQPAIKLQLPDRTDQRKRNRERLENHDKNRVAKEQALLDVMQDGPRKFECCIVYGEGDQKRVINRKMVVGGKTAEEAWVKYMQYFSMTGYGMGSNKQVREVTEGYQPAAAPIKQSTLKGAELLLTGAGIVELN